MGVRSCVLVALCLVGCQYEHRDMTDDAGGDTTTGGDGATTGASTGGDGGATTGGTTAGGDGGTTGGVGTVTGARVQSAAVSQCTDDGDCTAQKCANDDTCFRTCNGDVCDSGCTGVCRDGGSGKCADNAPPDASTCAGIWLVPWDAQGCPGTPVCGCTDQSACAAVSCGKGEALVAGDDCCPRCISACDDDTDCESGFQCVRDNGCAQVVCPDASDKRLKRPDCEKGRECYGVCKSVL